MFATPWVKENLRRASLVLHFFSFRECMYVFNDLEGQIAQIRQYYGEGRIASKSYG